MITAWRIVGEGHKQDSACVTLTADGQTLAASKGLWVALTEPSAFGATTKGAGVI